MVRRKQNFNFKNINLIAFIAGVAVGLGLTNVKKYCNGKCSCHDYKKRCEESRCSCDESADEERFSVHEGTEEVGKE